MCILRAIEVIVQSSLQNNFCLPLRRIRSLSVDCGGSKCDKRLYTGRLLKLLTGSSENAVNVLVLHIILPLSFMSAGGTCSTSHMTEILAWKKKTKTVWPQCMFFFNTKRQMEDSRSITERKRSELSATCCHPCHVYTCVKNMF